MALTGFNSEAVSSSINSVKRAYETLMDALVDETQSRFVDKMADNWACAEAQKFFTDGFKPAMDELVVNSSKVFQSIVDSMNSAAAAWATRTGSDSVYTKVAFTQEANRIDVSNIKENINGVRGIDEGNANTIANNLSRVSTSSTTALNNAKGAVSNCGFLGGSQAADLSNALETVKNKINNAINEIMEATKTAISTTVTQYGDIRSEIENAFSTNE